jgi:hypothetical protein
VSDGTDAKQRKVLENAKKELRVLFDKGEWAVRRERKRIAQNAIKYKTCICESDDSHMSRGPGRSVHVSTSERR